MSKVDYRKLLLFVLVVLFTIAVCVCACKNDLGEPYVNAPMAAVFLDDIDEEQGYQYSASNILARPNYKPHYTPTFYDGSSVAQLKGPQPPMSARGVRASPMDYVQMVSDSYDIPERSDVKRDELHAVGDFEDPSKYQDVSLPETNMEAMNFGKNPNDPNTYVHDRLIYANQKRRGRGEADLIRGDIPIANINAHKGWNQVSIVPHLDTVAGALGSGFVGSAFEHVGAQYETSVSQSGDVSVIREISENAIPISIERF